MKMIEVWETADGKTFKSITEARVHEECEKYSAEIDKFIASGECSYSKAPQTTVVKTAILQWMFWKEGKK